MDFKLSDDQKAVQDTAQKFATDHMQPNAAKWDDEKIFPVSELRKAADLGFGGLYVSPDFGGSGLGRMDSAIILEELGLIDDILFAHPNQMQEGEVPVSEHDISTNLPSSQA